MPDCPFYKTTEIRIKSKENIPSPEVQFRQRAYCSHQNSPMTRQFVVRSGLSLPCGGENSNCLIREKRDDLQND